ncbi:hypothetical protein A2U01_0027188, partial [Trifolium medium]|nr:hypothetical protein [Trifolium medium]MCI06132.1 hypothetical protein [Trifolium medium]
MQKQPTTVDYNLPFYDKFAIHLISSSPANSFKHTAHPTAGGKSPAMTLKLTTGRNSRMRIAERVGRWRWDSGEETAEKSMSRMSERWRRERKVIAMDL